MHPDGSGLKRITEHGNFCGSPKWTADSRRVIAYCMTAEQTLANRACRARSRGNDTRLVSIDIATGRVDRRAGGGRREVQSRRLSATTVGYIRKDASDRARASTTPTARSGPKGDVRDRVVVAGRHARRLSQARRRRRRRRGGKRSAAMPDYELTLTGHAAVVQPVGRSLRR